MGASTPSWTIQERAPGDADFVAALHLAVMACPPNNASIAQPVQDLLEQAAGGGLRLRPVVGAYEGDVLRVAVVGVESPGGFNLVLVPFELNRASELEGGLLALRRVCEFSRRFGVNLSQVLGPDRTSNWDAILRDVGFIRLTDLVYMTCAIPGTNLMVDDRIPARDHHWVTYSARTEPLFCEAIRRSYLQSMDCPELTNMRTAEQALAAYRAVGVFDPAKWFVLAAGDEPRGVLLLSKMRALPVMEIVYMGVSQLARGRGLGNVLMSQALRETAKANATNLILAVDSRNDAARRLYMRRNFVEIARRAAWIANLCAVGR